MITLLARPPLFPDPLHIPHIPTQFRPYNGACLLFSLYFWFLVLLGPSKWPRYQAASAQYPAAWFLTCTPNYMYFAHADGFLEQRAKKEAGPVGDSRITQIWSDGQKRKHNGADGTHATRTSKTRIFAQHAV
ncbi:hypothetical protein BDN71DRAFT_1508079 [Pleurotus eryngii]|uniref:Uncharacterized protein n=1 Tax=Pleurotus eryngii TaxID=5323 RepID=A0A9P5ZXA1_PLEER|nr:hypothetical protein BDN71DRAFT_1508079 [Pleurotus eryngii]